MRVYFPVLAFMAVVNYSDITIVQIFTPNLALTD